MKHNCQTERRINAGRWAGRGLLAGLLLPALLLVTGLMAQTGPVAARVAARLSSVQGQVRLTQGDEVLAETAVPNVPLFEGAVVATAESGEAEIQFVDGSVARIPPMSSVALDTLRRVDAGTDTQVELLNGLAYFELSGSGMPGNFRLSFGNVTVTASGPAILRINLDTPPGELAVFSGNAHLVIGSDLNSGKALDLGAGQSVALNAVSPSQYRVAEAIEPDSWDSWNADRDQELAAVNSARTQATGSMGDPGNAAWGDLDANGNWYNVPGQGYVWSPNEAAEAGFDPYANGNWFWTPGSGYVWVSGYSWGYMPYQCGLWNYYDGFGWGWSTGMNGCNPWWDTGYVAPNIATSVRGYLAPLRPHLPVWRVPGRPPFSGPRPMIAVHRAPLADGHPTAARDKSSVVTIAGATVLPLRPLPLASSHFSSPSGGFDHSRPVNMPGFPPAATNRSAYGPTHTPAGAMPAGRPAQSAPASGSSGARSSAASSSHSSASTSSAAHSSSAASSSSSGSSHSSSSSSSGGKK